MSEVKLLPLLPTLTIAGDDPDRGHWVRVEEAKSFARANLAERDAEVAELRKRDAEWNRTAGEAVARAERLAEALRELASQLQYADKHAQVTKDVAGEFICLPPWLWIEIRDKARAALDQETSNG